LRIEAGQFRTLFGIEGLGAGDFYSRSFSFQFLQPILGKGARASVTLGEGSSLTGIVQNGLSRVDDATKDLSLGISYARPVGEDANLRVNLSSGREATPAGVRSVAVANAVYKRTFGDDTTFALDGTVRVGRDLADDNVNTTGIAAYLTRPLGNGGAFAIRGEYVAAGSATTGLLPTGLTPALKPNLTSITFAYHLPGATDNSRTILEYRYDRSNDFLFEKGVGAAKKDQGTLTIGQIFRF
ncbi:MAG: outer membrane beta-barrel protein, partial [Armatimonadaceae bacterium]